MYRSARFTVEHGGAANSGGIEELGPYLLNIRVYDCVFHKDEMSISRGQIMRISARSWLVICVQISCCWLDASVPRATCYVRSTNGSYDRAFAFRALRNAQAVLTFLVGVLNFVKRTLSSSRCGRRCPSSCRLAFSSGGSVISFVVLRICDGVLVFSSARISEHGGVEDSCRKQELGPGYILAAE